MKYKDIEIERRKVNGCDQCGDDNDLMRLFTKYNVCDKCTLKNYKKSTRR